MVRNGVEMKRNDGSISYDWGVLGIATLAAAACLRAHVLLSIGQ